MNLNINLIYRLVIGVGLVRLKNLTNVATAGTIVIAATDFCSIAIYVVTYFVFARQYQQIYSAFQFLASVSLSTVARLCLPAIIFFILRHSRQIEIWHREM